MMKKITAILVCLALAMTFTACGSKTEASAPAAEAPAAASTPAPAPVPAPAPATSEPTAAPEPEITTVPAPEIVYVQNGQVVESTTAPDGSTVAVTPEPALEYTFEGTVNTLGSSSMTVTADSISVVFNLIDGTVLPATITPGDEVKVIYVKNASGSNDAKTITVSKEKETPVTGIVIGCVTECDNSHVNLFVDGKLYNFVIDKDTKVNASYFDVNDYLRVTYEGVLTGNVKALQIDVIQDITTSKNVAQPSYTAYPVVTSYPVVIVTPRPYTPEIKPAQNPMMTGTAQVVSVGDGIAVVRISGSGNDSWMTISSDALGAGKTISAGENIKIDYNSGTDTITHIYK